MLTGGWILLGVIGLGIGAVTLALGFGAVPIPLAVADTAQRVMGLDLHPKTLGWMDETKAFSDADRKRLAEIAGQVHVDSVDSIRAIQSGERARLTRRDFELLRQDRRRAIAAYPDLPLADLLEPGWLNVSYRDHVPVAFCSSGNFSSTAEKDGGPAYLDGPCYMETVKASYTDRTDGPTANRVLAELRSRTAEERTRERAENGYHLAVVGSGGSLSMNCEPGGKCVVTRAAEWSKRATRWTFDYVPSEWTGDPTMFESFPSFRNAISDEVDIVPSGVSSTSHIGTTTDRPDVHGTVSPVPPPPPSPQPGR